MPSLKWTFLLSALTVLIVAQNDYTCNPNKPCKQGCCGNSGYCGYGPAYCGSGNCTSSCNSKAECDAGWGPQWSAAEKCPLNVCCSKYGFCGTSADFCGAGHELVPAPSCSGSSSNARTIGYYEGWSITRPCQGQYPENLELSAYTHLNFAFAYINPTTYHIAPMQDTDNGLYLRINNLKQLNTGLKVFISIGGWSMNDPGPTSSAFSNLVASSSAQQAFFSSLISFMQTNGFDGVDIDWEYPVAPEHAGRAADFANYVTFIGNLRVALTSAGGNYGLTLTLPASYWYLRNFDIVNLQQYVDWFNFLSYDLHGTWDASDPYVGAIIGAHTNLTEINSALNLLWRNNINPNKVVLGLGFYGRSFTLQNPSCNAAGCPFSAGGNPGPCTQTSGILSGIEIGNILANGSATTTWDHTAAVKIATFGGNQWVSYDDADTLAQKVKYANANCLGGTMVWAIDLDNGTLARSLSQSTGRQNLSNSNLPDGGRSYTYGPKNQDIGNDLADSSTPLGSCEWTTCHPTKAEAMLQCLGKGKVVSAVTESGCVNVFAIFGRTAYRSFCCPANNAPTCKTRSTRDKSRAARCSTSEVSVDTYTFFDYNYALCCNRTASVYPFGSCQWSVGCGSYGSNATCPPAYSNAIAWSSIGNSILPCTSPSVYTLCCNDPFALVDCQVYDQPGYASAGSFGAMNPGIPLPTIPGFPNPPQIGSCNGQCGDEQVLVGTDATGCTNGGVKAICCQQNGVVNNIELLALRRKLLAFKNEPSCSAGQINDVLYSINKRSFSYARSQPWDTKWASNYLKARNLDTIGYADLAFVVDAALNNYGGNVYAQQVTNIFDAVFAPGFYADNFTTLNDIATANDAYYGIDAQDPIVNFIALLCEYTDAANEVATVQAVSDQLCVNDPCANGECSNGGTPSQLSDGSYVCAAPTSKRDVLTQLRYLLGDKTSLPYSKKASFKSKIQPYKSKNSIRALKDLEKRIVLQGNAINRAGQGVNSGRMMRAIMGGQGDSGPQPPVLYFRTFLDPSNSQDTIMEIAWDIRQRPDLNGGDPNNNWYPRIPRAHFYHGQRVQNIRGSGSPLWAVQFYPVGGNRNRPNTGATARTQIVNCRPANRNLPAVAQRNWMPPFTLGLIIRHFQANQPPFDNITGGGQTQAFGVYLRNQGFYTQESYDNWNYLFARWDTINPATNANRLPNGATPRDMAPGTSDNWPEGDPPIN